jgi:ABC-type nitrate/sulfonate/bicarbonate transport system permease component
VIWPVLLNTIDGARTVHPDHLETARAFRLGTATRLTRVILPSAAPKILAGLRLALSLALVMVIISEFLLTMHEGQERTISEYEAMLAAAGFRLADVAELSRGECLFTALPVAR